MLHYILYLCMMNMILKFIIYALFLTCLSMLAAQKCDISLSGKVVDAHESHYLEFATLYFKEIDAGIITDSTGSFTYDNICPGQYHISVSHIGCQTRSFYIDIQQDTILNFMLEHHDELLEEVVIKGIDTKSKKGLHKVVLSKSMIEELHGKTLSEMMASIPGVSMLRAGPNLVKPIINGLYGQRIAIFNQGVPQEGQQWGNDHAPEIDPNTGDKISIYKGANAIRFGLNALGGMITIEADELKYDPHWHGDVKFSGQSNGRTFGLSTSVYKTTSLGKGKLTATYNKGGDRHTPNYYLTNTGNEEVAFSGLISNRYNSKSDRKIYYSYYQSSIGVLRGSHIGNLTDLMAAFNRDIPFFTKTEFSYKLNAPRQNVSHHLMKYSQKQILNSENTLNLDIAFQVNNRKEFDVRRGEKSQIPSLHLLLLSQYYDLHLIHAQNAMNLVHDVGIQYKNGINSNQPETGISPLLPDFIQHQGALYYILKDKLKYFDFESGVRTEFRNYKIFRPSSKGGNSSNVYLNFAINAGLRREVSSMMTTTLDISFANRPPEINELYSNGLHQGVSGIEEGSEMLRPETSFKLVNEWNGHTNKIHHINFSLFYNRYWNFIYLQATNEIRLTIRGAFPVFKYNETEVVMSGFNIKSNLNITKHLQWSNAMSYTYAQNLNTQRGLIRIPPLNATSILSLSCGKSNIWNESKFGIEMQYTARQNHIDPNEDFLPPPCGYLLSNISWRIKWMTKHQKEISWIVRAENIFNVEYRDYLNRLRYFSDEMGRNIFCTLSITY